MPVRYNHRQDTTIMIIILYSEKEENVQSIIHYFLFVLGELPKKHPETFPHFLLLYIHVSGNE